MTNGEKIKEIYPKTPTGVRLDVDGTNGTMTFTINEDWWNAEYEGPRKGHWLRMSDLSEQEDDRYKCSHCGNVVHYTNKMNLYTFNSWCGRCGSDNGMKIEVEV